MIVTTARHSRAVRRGIDDFLIYTLREDAVSSSGFAPSPNSVPGAYVSVSLPKGTRHALARDFSAREGRCFVSLVLCAASFAAGQAVTTYHVDNNRTGWNSHETVLTPANVGSSSFGLLHAVALNDQVDGQPLFVPAVNITAGKSKGVHDVVYVATEGNTIYAIDAESGKVLLKPNFGTPVSFPLGCTNNGPNVGINSTPVIDLSSKTMYVVIYTQDSYRPGLSDSCARSWQSH